MSNEIDDYFNLDTRISRLIEEIKLDKKVRDNLRNQLTEFQVKISSVSESERSVVYSDISRVTTALKDIEELIKSKERDLGTLLAPTIDFEPLTFY